MALLRRTFAMLGEQRRLTVWTLLVSTALITVALLAHLGANAFAQWQRAYHRGASMVVYLQPAVDQAAATKLAADLTALAGVERAEYVSPQESESRLRRALSGSEQLLDGIEPSTMPASIELVLEPGIRDVIEVSAPFRALRASGQFEDVEVSGEWSDQTSTTLNIIGLVARTIKYGFVAIAALVVLFAARMRWERGAPMLAVARLLGAGPGYTRLPAALASLIVSAGAAALAVALTWLLHNQFATAVSTRLASSMVGMTIAPLAREQALLTIAVGAGLGLLGGLLAGDRARR